MYDIKIPLEIIISEKNNEYNTSYFILNLNFKLFKQTLVQNNMKTIYILA